ncbi:MAG: YlxM family DNA-binding protein [Clostridiaceae bacterium]|nr:YlxM family DNA-binding protein [Clostridiaceae bacterium]
MHDNDKASQGSINAVEDVYEIAVLLDFYGLLLTERQYDIMDLHYNGDLSLGEIASDLGISRQGVYDGIRKAKQALIEYEKRLGLVERFREQEKIIEQALENLKRLGDKHPALLEDKDYKKAVNLLDKVLDTL